MHLSLALFKAVFFRFLFVFFFAYPLAQAARASTTYEQLPKSAQKAWLHLLHFGRGDSPLFYFRPESSKESFWPSLELEENKKLLPDETKRGGHFQQPLGCVFPARVSFLKKYGLWPKEAANFKCLEYEEWKQGLTGGQRVRVSLVFTTAYPNNPASLFGHTFLRFKRQDKAHELLDYTVSFNAMMAGEDNGVIYAIKGLAGGYRGEFDFSPYYLKVQEYNNSEGRDLFEYVLNLSDEEIDFLIAHLWELYSSAWFDYFFLDENCSFVLAQALNAAVPHWDLFNVHRGYYLPADLIKFVTQIPGAVNEVHRRPALKKNWRAQFDLLSSDEKKTFLKLIDPKQKTKVLSETVSAKSLDLALIWLGVEERQSSKNRLSEDKKNLRSELFIKRAQMKDLPEINLTNQNKEILGVGQENERPDWGKNPMKGQLAYEQSRVANHTFENHLHLRFKWGYHDLLDDDRGYSPFSHFDFFGGMISRIGKEGKWKVTEIRGIEITSLHPLSFENRSPSWTLGATYERFDDLSCRDCSGVKTRAGLGLAFDANNDYFSSRPFFLVNILGDAADYFDKGLRLGLEVNTGLIFDFGHRFKLLFNPKLRRSFWGEDRPSMLFLNKVGLSWPLGPLYEWRLEIDSTYDLKDRNHLLERKGLWIGRYF